MFWYELFCFFLFQNVAFMSSRLAGWVVKDDLEPLNLLPLALRCGHSGVPGLCGTGNRTQGSLSVEQALNQLCSMSGSESGFPGFMCCASCLLEPAWGWMERQPVLRYRVSSR